MLQRVAGATNRTLTYVGLAALGVITGLQAVIFALWGDDGDPPDAVVAIAFVPFWGAVSRRADCGLLGSEATYRFTPHLTP